MKKKSSLNRIIAVASALTIALTTLCTTVFAESHGAGVLKVGFFAMDGYHNETGSVKSGYGYDYMQKLRQYLSYDFDYVGYEKSWSEMLNMLDKGEIDLLTSSQKTSGLENDYLFSDYPIGTSSYTINVKKGNTRFSVSDYSALNGIKLGVLKGDAVAAKLPDFALNNGITYTAVFYDSEELMQKALADGIEIEAVVGNSLRRCDDEVSLVTINTEPFYVMARKSDKELMNRVNHAISALQLSEPAFSSELSIRYYSIGNIVSSFTAEEKAYIAKIQSQSGIISAYMRPDGFPLAYFDDAEAKGLVAELIKEIQNSTGLTFKITDTYTPETQICINTLTGFSSGNALVTEPYIRVSCVGLMKRNTTSVKTAAVFSEDKTAAVIVTENKDITPIFYDSVSDCINAVRDGKADITYIDGVTADSIVYSDEQNALLVTALPNRYYEYAISVQNGEDPLLYSVLNNAAGTTASNSSAEKIALMLRENFTENKNLVSFVYDMPFVALAGVIIVFVLIIILMVVTFRATLILRESNDKLQINELISVISTDSSIFEYDLYKNFRISYKLLEDGEIEAEKTAFDGEAFPSGFVLDESGMLMEKYFSRRALSDIARSKRTEQIQCQVKSEGQYKYEIITIKGVPQNKKRRCNVFVSRRVIDDEKRKEFLMKEQCAAADAYARMKEAEKSGFVANLAHKIKMPLSTVIASSRLFSKGGGGHSDGCVLAADEIFNIISDSSYCAQIEGRRLSPVLSDFSLRAIISELSELIERKINSKNLVYRIAYENVNSDAFFGDGEKLLKILYNLLSNAVRYSKEGGSITLTIVQDALTLRFFVTDNGMGIKEGIDIFAQFAVGNYGVSNSSDYTGLELFTAKYLTEFLGGKISYNSRAGFGATFAAEIPFQAARGDLKSVDISGMKILVADSDGASLEYEAELSRELCAEVKTVGDGFAAINAINDAIDGGEPYSLCILENGLTEMNAIEVVRRFRRYINVNVPFAVMAAVDVAEIRHEYEAYNIQVVEKPLKASTLKKLLEDTARENLPDSAQETIGV